MIAVKAHYDGTKIVCDESVKMKKGQFLIVTVVDMTTINEKIPNLQTRAALDEYDEMKNNPKEYKRYDSFDDAINEVFFDA